MATVPYTAEERMAVPGVYRILCNRCGVVVGTRMAGWGRPTEEDTHCLGCPGCGAVHETGTGFTVEYLSR